MVRKYSSYLSGLVDRELLGVNPQFPFTKSRQFKSIRSGGSDILYVVDNEGQETLPFNVTHNNISNNGSLLAISDEVGNVSIVNSDIMNGNRQLTRINPHENAIFDTIFSPDDTFLLTCSGDSTAKVSDLESGSLLYTLIGHTASIKSGSISSDNPSLIATAGRDGYVFLWDLRCSAYARDPLSGSPFHKPVDIIRKVHEPENLYANSRNSSSRGASPATTPRGNQAKVFTAAELAQSSASSVRFLEGGSHGFSIITSGTSDGCIKLWDIRNIGSLSHKKVQTPAVTVKPHDFITDSGKNKSSPTFTAQVMPRSISLTGSLKSSTSNDSLDVPTNPFLIASSAANISSSPSTFKTHRRRGFSSMALTEDKSKIFAVSTDSFIYEINSRNLQPVQRFSSPGFACRSFYIKLSATNDYLAAGSSNGSVYLWSLNDIKNPVVLEGHTGEVSGVSLRKGLPKDCDVALSSCSDDHSTRIWKPRYIYPDDDRQCLEGFAMDWDGIPSMTTSTIENLGIS